MNRSTRTRRERSRRADRRTPREVDPAVEVPDLIRRIGEAVDLGGDRLDPRLVEGARAEIDRTGARAELGSSHTVVALAGSTGSGKSSLFNAVAGFAISTVGVRRPTTSDPVACIWGEGADPLLDWLEVPSRYRTAHGSALNGGADDRDLAGLVLLDMPDHDSRETAHRDEVERLVDRIDLVVWVVDPQKYADEALHVNYLQRFSGHDGVLVVVLNQVDRLPDGERAAVLADLRRLVREDGLPRATVMATSTVTGEGVAQLHGLFADAVASKAMALGRARAALREVAIGLRTGVADAEPVLDPDRGDARLTEALAGAASVPAVVSAVGAGYRRQARAHVGWPLTRWVGRFRRDPLKRLGLSERQGPEGSTGLARSSVPAPSRAQLARVDLAERRLLDDATDGLPQRWADSVRQAPVHADDLRDALDQAVLSTDLTFRRPRWWALVGFLHIVLAAAAVLGLLGLLALFALDFLQVPYPDLPGVPGLPAWFPVPLPTALAVVGLLGGALLALVAGSVVPARAQARAARAEARLRSSVAEVAKDRVLVPVAGVLDEHRRCRELLGA